MWAVAGGRPYRVLRSGATLVGEDSRDSDDLRRLHEDDIYVPIDPSGFAARLTAAGFVDVSVITNDYAVRFQGTKP